MTTATIFAGFGGQGVLLMGYVLAHGAMHKGVNVTYLPAYGPEMRGGTANCTVTISEKPIASPVTSRPDFLVAMNNPSLTKFESKVRPGGIVFLDESLVSEELQRKDVTVVRVPLRDLAKEVGSEPDIDRFAKPYAGFYFTNPHDRGGRPQAMPALSRITESLAAEPVFHAARVAIADPRLRREDLDMLREWARSLSGTVENPDLGGTETLLYLLIALPTSWSQTGMPPYDRPLDEASGQKG